MNFSQEYLNSRLLYNPETGLLSWKEMNDSSLFQSKKRMDSWNVRYANTSAGCIQGAGYLVVRLRGVNTLCHRIVWVMLNGEIPPDFEIDHIDGIKSNNRDSNLRLATRTQNSYNRGANGRNAFGLKGVNLHLKNQNYRASICANGKNTHIGSFPTKGLAAVAYAKESIRLHGANSIFLSNQKQQTLC